MKIIYTFVPELDNAKINSSALRCGDFLSAYNNSISLLNPSGSRFKALLIFATSGFDRFFLLDKFSFRTMRRSDENQNSAKCSNAVATPTERNTVKEIWKDIDGFEGRYQVSNFGNIKSVDKYIITRKAYNQRRNGILRKLQVSKNNYIFISLKKEGKQYNKYIHRLVAQAFIHNPENKCEINHIDCDKSNNHVSNLEWVTSSENKKHAFINNLMRGTCLYMNKINTLSKEKCSKKICQYSLEGEFIRGYNSIKEASKKMGCTDVAIGNCANGKSKKSMGFLWKFANEEKHLEQIMRDVEMYSNQIYL